MRLPILCYGDPTLRKKSEPIQEITDEIRQLVRDMIETSDKGNGIGISACQVGRPIRLFVLRDYIVSEDGQWSISPHVKVYINPVITSYSEETVTELEACLSLPGLRGNVERPLRITIQAQDLNGNLFEEELEGYNARVRMHENDHLNGVLYIDRVDAKTRREMEPKLRALKKQHMKM